MNTRISPWIYRTIGLLLVVGLLISPAASMGQFSVTPQVTNASCGYNNGSIYLKVAGGTVPILFSDNGGPTQTYGLFLSLAPGIHNIKVSDAKGNQYQASLSVLNFYQHPLLSVSNIIQPSACNTFDGSLTINATGGVPPYQYSVNGSNYFSSNVFTNLSPGTYLLGVRDANGCIVNSGFTFPDKCPNKVNFSYTKTVCGNTSVLIASAPPGGAVPYQYSLDGGPYQSMGFFQNISIGFHHLYTKDKNGVISINAFIVFGHCNLPLSAITSTAHCTASDGTITVTVTGGTSPFFYSIVGGPYQDANVLTGLASGTYVVQVRDGNGTIGQLANVVVGQECPTLTLSATPSGCTTNTGTVSVATATGIAPITYSIDGINFQSGKTFTGLAPGNYTVTSKDGSNFLTKATATVTTATGPTLNAVPSAAGCTVNNGSIVATGSGGALPYKYQINNNPAQASGNFTGLASATYTVKITDANGCTAQQSVMIGILPSPTLTATSTNAGCSVNNGTVTATPAGGRAPYSFQLGNGPAQASGAFSNVGSGTYTVTVTDANGCTAQQTVVVATANGPTLSLSATPTGCTVINGSISATPSGGVGPYTFQNNGGIAQPTGNFNNLGVGNYIVGVQDANGCRSQQAIDIAVTPNPTLSATANAATCSGNNGSILASAADGIAPFQYTLGAGAPQASGSFPTLANGNYQLQVTDANGCSAQQTVTVDLVNSISIDAGADSSICAGKIVGLHGSNPAGDLGYTYSWSPAADISDPSILQPLAHPAVSTEYVLTATAGVCTAKDSLLVTVNPLPVANAGADASICFDQDYQLQGSGGSVYSWSPATFLDNAAVANPSLINPTQSVTYKLSVTDLNGCISVDSDVVTIQVSAQPIVFAGDDTAVMKNTSFNLQAIDVNNTGFTSYLWSPSIGLNDPSLQNPMAMLTAAQTYTVTATTANNCSATDDINIKVFDHPDIYVPNAFTPNNDGINDLLHAIPIGIQTFKFFVIYNRYGQQVFITHDAGIGWNGTIGGTPQDIGGFVWRAEGIDFNGKPVVRSGTLVLIH